MNNNDLRNIRNIAFNPNYFILISACLSIQIRNRFEIHDISLEFHNENIINFKHASFMRISA